jgi:hypothetical protein
MKALIKSVKFQKEYDSKFGKMYSFKIGWDDETAYYSSKNQNQTYFVEGKEAEFSVEEKTSDKGKFKTIKPITSGNLSGFSKNLKKEQSRYSGFSLSYAKDLVVAGKAELKDLLTLSEKLFNHMVELDKKLENDLS